MEGFFHVFDLDETLCSKNMSVAFGRFLYQKKVITFLQASNALSYYALFKAGIISIQILHQRIFEQIFKDRTIHEISLLVSDFLKTLDKALRPLANSFLKAAQSKGHTTALFSSSPDFLVIPVVNILKIDYVLATEYVVNSEGRLSHIHQIIDGEAKAEQLKKLSRQLGFSQTQIIAYNDDEDRDLPMLQLAGRSVVFNSNNLLLIKNIINLP